MSERQILVCDDDLDRGKNWANRVQKALAETTGFVVAALPPHEFAAAFRGLESRRALARDVDADSIGPADEADLTAASRIDSADVLIVDYDLSPDKHRTPDPLDDGRAVAELLGKSGEDFIYLARCFSGAKGVVVVNQEVQRQSFDLTLQRFSNSLADVNVTGFDIGRSSLWLGAGEDFHPWSWPPLCSVPMKVERRMALIGDLDQLVLDALQLADNEHFYALTQTQLDPLGDDPQMTTFRMLATQSRLGLKGHDKGLGADDELVRRVATVAVARWLECFVVPAQNVLIDLPHLAQRFPAVVIGDRRDADVWNRVASLEDVGDAVNTDLLSVGSADAASDWTSRQVWSLPRIATAARAIARPAPPDGPVFVFCEDTSRFVDLSAAHEFESGVAGPFIQRFVEQLDDIEYSPRGRLR